MSKVASGFQKPHDISWAPGCEYFAFIDSGSLWIGSLHQEPQKVSIGGQARDYSWSADGKEIALTAARSECGAQAKGSYFGDVFTLSVPGGVPDELTQDCRSYQLGWSSDSRQLLIQRDVTYKLPCDPVTPPCAGSDLMVLNVTSKSARTLLNAKELTQRSYSIDSLLLWDVRLHTIYMSNRISPFYGNRTILTALRDTDGKQLWAEAGEWISWLGENAFQLYRIVPGGDQGLEFRPALLNFEGEEIHNFPVAGPLTGNWSPDLRYFVELMQNHGTQSAFQFNSPGGTKLWSYFLPQDVNSCTANWIPADLFLIKADKKNLANNLVEESLWLLNPDEKNGGELFHGNMTAPDSSKNEAMSVTCNSSRSELTVARWNE